MKNLIILTLCLIAIFSVVACHKDEPVFASCEGRILEKGSNKPIANAMIIVQSCIANVDKFSLSCAPIDTIYSDANGRYSYYLDEKGLAKHDGARHIEFFATKARYFNQEFPAIISGKGAKTIDIILPPSAWLKLHVKAVNHYGSNDDIKIQGLYAGEGGGFDAINKIGEYSKLYLKAGNDSTTIYWIIRISGNGETRYSKKVYLPALDTTEFKLFF